jgi:deoxyhypusine synthase
LVQDIKLVNDTGLFAKKSGMIVLGGGVIKHHINTATEVDGSDAGARPDEAKSWGKIKVDAKAVKVYAECSLVVPILIGETFVRNFDLAKRT